MLVIPLRGAGPPPHAPPVPILPKHQLSGHGEREVMCRFSSRRTTEFSPALRGWLGRLCVWVPCALLAHVGLSPGLRAVLGSDFGLKTCDMEIVIIPAPSGKWEQWLR